MRQLRMTICTLPWTICGAHLFMTRDYLTQKGKEVDGRYCLAIPNQEIKNIVTERILTLFRNDVRKDGRAVL